MSERKKRNIIIGALCGVLLLMVVGYAAFSTVLDINGTANISSNWNIQITKIEKIASVGATDNTGSPSYESLSATFNTNLTSPGDYATYKIEITNSGSLNAVLSKITIPNNTNNDIKYYLNKDQNEQDISGALNKNSVLYKSGETGNVGYVYVTVLYRSYENQTTAQNKTASMTISFEFTQQEGTLIGAAGDDDFTGIVYNRNVLSADDNIDENRIKRGDPLSKITNYTENYNALGSNFFLKYNITNGQVVSREVCFIKGNLYCLTDGDSRDAFNTNKGILENAFGETACGISTDSSLIVCDDDSMSVSAELGGSLWAGDDSVLCNIDASVDLGDRGYYFGTAGCSSN